MKKGLLSIFLFVFTVFLAFAQNENDFEIEQNRQGKITIKGYTGIVTDVVIPTKISGIDVTEIATMAFNGRKRENLPSLTSVVIPNSVIKIGETAFRFNVITRVTLGSNVEIIDRTAFANNKITNVTLPNKLKVIEEGVFSSNRLENITIPNSAIAIRNAAFDDNPLKSVSIGAGVKDISPRAFGENNPITSITIGNNVNINKYSGLEEGFINFYISQNKREGKYEKTGSLWKRQ